ncbi:hypothetical protein D9M72_77460 [compost metagenome]
MALLDALTYIIDADNSKLNKEIDKSEKKTDEFGKSMLTAEGRAGLMEQKIKGAFTRIGAAILATVAASKALETFNNHVQTVEQIRNTSDALGVAIEDVDAFGKAIERMGGDAQGARDSLTDMAESIGEALQDVDSGRAKTFKALGISLKDVNGQAKNAVQGMVELAGAVEGMGREEAVFRIKELGITDNRTVELLLKGRQEVERMLRVQKQQGGVTKESAERAKAYSEAMAKFRDSTDKAAGGIVDWILPAVTWFIDKLDAVVSWMNKHDHVVKGFFIGLTTVLAAMFLPAAISATAAIWAMIAPFLAIAAPIAAAIALFVLAYDDIMTFREGGESLIGLFIERFPLIGDVIKAVGGVIMGVFYLLTGQFEKAGEMFSLVGAKMVNVGNAMAKGIAGAFGATVEYLKSVWVYIMGMFEKVSTVIQKIGKWLGFGSGDDIQVTASTVSNGVSDAEAKAAENMKAAQAQLDQAAANPMNSVTSNAISNASNTHTETNIQVGEVNVQTQATDAQGISQSIGGGLKDELKNLQSDSASGVKR